MLKKQIYSIAMSFPMIRKNTSDQENLSIIVKNAIELNQSQEVQQIKFIRTAAHTLLAALYVGIFLASSSFRISPIFTLTMFAIGFLPIYYSCVRSMYRHAAWIAFKEEVDNKLYRWEQAMDYLKSSHKNRVWQLFLTFSFFCFTLVLIASTQYGYLWALFFSVGLFTTTSYLSIHAHLIGAAIVKFCDMTAQ